MVSIPLVTAAPLAALLLLLAAPLPAAARQASSAGETSAYQGVFTKEQAERGQAQFHANCAECHIAQEFTGNAFMRAWTGRRVFDLFDLIRTTMPMTNPGRLSRQVYADIVAYLLQANNLPAGATPLPSDDDALKKIRLATEKNETR
jgi:S-disulfanyl-L-cysteine oxidoreductase SoxD